MNTSIEQKIAALFPDLAPQARVWIYQSNRAIEKELLPAIEHQVKQFVAEWTAHSKKVIADGAVFENHFIILAADEAAVKVSGCSIDSSVAFMRQLQEKYALDFFDRFHTVYIDAHQNFQSVAKDQLQQLLREGKVTSGTLLFNNMVQTLGELKNNWLVPLKNSWHARFFDSVGV